MGGDGQAGFERAGEIGRLLVGHVADAIDREALGVAAVDGQEGDVRLEPGHGGALALVDA